MGGEEEVLGELGVKFEVVGKIAVASTFDWRVHP